MNIDRDDRKSAGDLENRMAESCPANLVKQALESEFSDASALEAALDRLSERESRSAPEALDAENQSHELVGLPTYDARQLIDGAPQARILLDGNTYFLRITRAGKLLLTK